MKTRVEKQDLLAKLVANREDHRAVFEEAIKGYREEAVELLEEHIEKLSAGKKVNLYVGLPEPEDHTRDYDRVISMVEMEVENVIDLSEEEFAQYVMDDWAWKRQWVDTISNYHTSYTPT